MTTNRSHIGAQARATRTATANTRRANVIEDVEFLKSWATHPDNIAARVDGGITIPALTRLLHRAGRPDLANYLEHDRRELSPRTRNATHRRTAA